MGNRKALSRSTRFEVFKRDGFKCQYCGRSAPDVVLEVDHIVPVAEGGENDIMNLVTSCRECNSGKGKKLLDDNAVVKKQMAELEIINEKREQLEMLLEWKQELIKYENELSDTVLDYINSNYPRKEIQENDELVKNHIRKAIKQFGVEEVLKATFISFDKYYCGDWETWLNALKKIGGICYNRINKIYKSKKFVSIDDLPEDITSAECCTVVFHIDYYKQFREFCMKKYHLDIEALKCIDDYKLKAFFDSCGPYYDI